MKRLLISAAVIALLTGCATTPPPPVAQAPVLPETPQSPSSPPPADDPKAAKAFTDAAEAKLASLSEYDNRVQWVGATYITDDTEWLQTKADAELNAETVKLATEAAKYNNVDADPVTRRKLDLLKLSQVLPAANTPGAAEQLAALTTRLNAVYATGKFSYNGKTYNLDDASNLLAASRDPRVTRAVWDGWYGIAAPMKDDYARMVVLANAGAQGLGFADTGALWRSNYDMDPDAFAAETDRLWGQVAPFYKSLHCYVRRKLNERYGDAVQPKFGPIRADLLGNMWAQDWSNIYDVVAPAGIRSSYSLDKLLVQAKYTPDKMVHTGEAFYTSLGFDPLPQTFWARSQITRPRDREVVCHASAWDVDNVNDVRIKTCLQVNADDFYTVHHELGHNFYQRAYADQPYLFKNGANDGFHEAIGDFIGLSSVTPTYLNQIGVLNKVPGEEEDIPYLLKMALQKVAFLPFGLEVDRWRWEVFSGKISEAEYNRRWWQLVTHYQGLTAPDVRPMNAFDPGAKYHVAANVPYTRYFLAAILQFQFQRAACQQMGWTGPLDRCSIYGQKAVGARLNKMLELGQSQPWPDTLEVFTGQRDMDASAILDYFKPLQTWLDQQNAGQKCGWEEGA